MSRIAKSPVNLPAGVDVKFKGQEITVKGAKGTLSMVVGNDVDVKQEDKVITFAPKAASKQGVLSGNCS